ncbi:hypothetical protein ACH4ZX_36675 [Streptomyces sp. NPDC020490]|uniref:hypothetical protein n=1 Tax=Streptomyces sp. NPDC020490 TaxID=3365078 RepID=UPI0037B32D45
MKLRFPFRVVRTSVLDELREKADAADTATVHCAAALFALQTVHSDRDQVLERLDGIVDDLQVHILRRHLAVELLQEIDPTELPHEVAEHIRTAREALIRGGEEEATA